MFIEPVLKSMTVKGVMFDLVAVLGVLVCYMLLSAA